MVETNSVKCPVPSRIMDAAINETMRHFIREDGKMYCTDNWGEAERDYCRSLLPREFWTYDTDFIGRWAISRRKSPSSEVIAVNGGKTKPKKPKHTEEYERYLDSEEWKRFRKVVLVFWNNQCSLCNSMEKLDVHHRTYKRVPHCERLQDCLPLCRACHTRVHASLECDEHYVTRDY